MTSFDPADTHHAQIDPSDQIQTSTRAHPKSPRQDCYSRARRRGGCAMLPSAASAAPYRLRRAFGGRVKIACRQRAGQIVRPV